MELKNEAFLLLQPIEIYGFVLYVLHHSSWSFKKFLLRNGITSLLFSGGSHPFISTLFQNDRTKLADSSVGSG